MNDLISRQALINKAEYEAEAMQEPFKSQLPVLVTWLAEKIPSEEPERKKGKWDFIGYQMFQCTSCGSPYTQGQLADLRLLITDPLLPKFCPNCGSYNEGEEDD